MKGFGIAAAMALALLPVACGSDSKSESLVTKSCTMTVQNSYKYCAESTADKSVVDQVMAQCTQGGGTASDSTCSTSGAVGKCTFGNAGGTNTTYIYSPADKTQAQTFCGQMSSNQGTFTAL
ncbi:MAG: hypothetical protein HYT87_03535 [Nitrospirae bacterium]|nr:hypothetical protein [Nitrospirota bacterium]